MNKKTLGNNSKTVLDLHGTKHDDVERLLENFVLLNQPPLTVITGNSDYMKNIVETFCVKHKITCEQWTNYGEYKILK